MNVTPPPSGPQNTEATSRQVEVAPEQRHIFSRWLVRIVDAISHLFGLRSPFEQNISRPETRIEERAPSVSQVTETQPVVTPQKQDVTRSVVMKSSTPVMDEVEKVPAHKATNPASVYRRKNKPVRQKPVKAESRSDELRRKKKERKQRRLEEKRNQYLSEGPKQTVSDAAESGVKSHKMKRMERKASEQEERLTASQMMNIDYLTEGEQLEQERLRAERINRQEFGRLADMGVDFGSQVVESRQEVSVENEGKPLPEVRNIRIPTEDMPAMVNTPEDKYQKTVATLFDRLKQEKDEHGLPLLTSTAEFRVCFAPLVAEPDLDVEEVVEAFVNFKKLQSIQSVVGGVEFSEAAFALLFELGELAHDPLEFEDVIDGPADLEDGFASVAENNEYHRIKQYKEVVTDLFDTIEQDLLEREQQLQQLSMRPAPEVDSGLSSDAGSGDETPLAGEQEDSLLTARLSEVAKRLEQGVDRTAPVMGNTDEKLSDSAIDSGSRTPLVGQNAAPDKLADLGRQVSGYESMGEDDI